MHTALIGASRGIGRATALRLLENPQNIVSLLLRTPSSIEADPDFQIHIGQGRVRIVTGDAEKPEDLARLFEPKGIDSIVITLGAVYPNGKRQFSWSQGFLLPSLDVCTRAMLNIVRVLDEMARAGRVPPKLVAISVVGVGKSAQHLPLVYKMVLPWLLQQTIADKRGLEAILSRVSSGLAEETDKPSKEVLDPSVLAGLTSGFIKEVLVVRPAQLKDTDGEGALRAGEDVSTYGTGRIELGRWIADALGKDSQWMNRRVSVGF